METIHSSRKRVVGGFYVYDSHVEQQALGTLCQGKSDAQGRLDCQVSLNKAGDVQPPAGAGREAIYPIFSSRLSSA